MQPRILLRLIVMPTFVSSVLAIALLPATASEAVTQAASDKATELASCDIPKTTLHKPDSSSATAKESIPQSAVEILVEYPALDFTAAESDAAVALFGCDCPACLNMLQQLRSQPLLGNGQGHCLTAMLERVSPQQVQQVLQNLDAENAN